jgi:hypothetical protein
MNDQFAPRPVTDDALWLFGLSCSVMTVDYAYDYWMTLWSCDGWGYDGIWTDLVEVQANCIGFASRRQDEILT